jgi:hypothetical protein
MKIENLIITHDPLDDAKGNAEALLYLKSQGFKLYKK